MRKIIAAVMVGTILMASASPAYADYENDLWCLSGIIELEAGNCTEDMMYGVGSVVMNRVTSPEFPNTIEEVVLEPGQYAPASRINSVERSQKSIDVAADLLENGSRYPSDVVWQANFPQGSYTYMTISTSYSVMYFCGG